MENQAFIRLALIQQNQAPQTLDKYICKLAELILLESNDNCLNTEEICKRINSLFLLSFDVLEVKNAINKKGRPQLLAVENGFQLSVSARHNLESQKSVDEKLDGFVKQFLERYPEYLGKDSKELLMKYIYHCFNTNTHNLMSLLQYKEISEISSFQATNDEINLINSFVLWDNSEKNEFLYFLITMYYEYCMLTVKKDSLLSRKLFKGKRFILDANIIFRMAGVNNDERQYVTKSFVEKCSEVGIELCYTDNTLDELYRVISSEVNYVRRITSKQEPVNYRVLDRINDKEELNDFYRFYYEWSKQPQNKYSDYEAFQKYLFLIIEEATKNLKFIRGENYELSSDSKKFDASVQSLRAYKTKLRKHKPTSNTSVKTDINNIMLVVKNRGNSNDGLWHTNDFIVSADQYLTNWAAESYSGIPIVVIPSVWLSIILRFSGRTNEDYRSFCMFLNLRPHVNQDESINTIQLLKTLNCLTTDASLKEKIIKELVENKNQYSYENDQEFCETAEKAFDKVLAEQCENNANDIESIKREFGEKLKLLEQNNKSDVETREKLLRDSTIHSMSRKQAFSDTENFRRIRSVFPAIWGVFIIVVLAVILGWCYNSPFCVKIVDALSPAKFQDPEKKFIFLQWIWVGVSAGVLAAVNGILSYFGSEQREKKLFEKILNRNKKMQDFETTGFNDTNIL